MTLSLLGGDGWPGHSGLEGAFPESGRI